MQLAVLLDYTAISDSGRRVKGRLDAVNAVDLEIRLKSRGLDLIRSRPAGQRFRLGPRAIPRRELINFCFHLEQLTRAGVPILDALADLRDSLDHPPFRATMASLTERIDGGATLSQAMAGHPEAFTPIFINLIAAGESSGQIPDILASLSDSLKWEDELAAQRKKLLLYPTLVASIVMAVTVFLMIFLVPQLKLFVKNMGQTLPLPTRLLFFVADSLVSYGYLLLILPAPCLIAAPFILRRHPQWQDRLDAVKLRLPLIGPILQKIILARLAALFAMLYAAGIPILESIRACQRVAGNRAIARALVEVEQHITEGRSVAEAFRDAVLFPPLVVRMLRVGETTGGLDSALRNVAYFYHRDVKESVAQAQTLIEPLLTLLMGALLGWIMLSVIGPIYDVISKIKP